MQSSVGWTNARRERESEIGLVSVYVRERKRECVCAYVCERERKRKKVRKRVTEYLYVGCCVCFENGKMNVALWRMVASLFMSSDHERMNEPGADSMKHFLQTCTTVTKIIVL